MFSSRNRVILMIVLVLSILGGLLVLLSGWMEDMYRRDLQTQLVSTRNQMHQDVLGWLKDKQRLLEKLAGNDELALLISQLPARGEYLLDQSLGRAIEVAVRLESLKDESDSVGFAVIDGLGNNLVASSPADWGQKDPVAMQPELLKALATGEPAYYFTRMSLLNEDASGYVAMGVLRVFHPVFHGNEVVAALALTVSIEGELARIFRLDHVWSNSVGYVFDRHGNLIAQHPRSARIPETRVPQPVLGYLALLRGEQGEFPAAKYNLDGYQGLMSPDVAGSWAWYNRMQLGMAIEVERKEAYGLLSVFETFSALITLIAALLVLGLVAVHARTGNALSSITRQMDQLLQGSGSMVLITDADGRFVRASQAFAALFQRDSLPGKTYADVMPEDLAAHWRLLDLKVLQQGEVQETVESVLVESSRQWWQLRRFPLRDNQQRIVAVAIVGHDITEHKRTEETLELHRQKLDDLVLQRTRQVEQERQRLDEIINQAVDAIISIDQTGIIETFNPAAERMFGYSREEAVGHNISLLMEDAIAFHHDKYLHKYAAGERESVVVGRGRQLLARTRDKRLFPVEISVARTAAAGRPGFVGVIRDLTERKEQDQILKVLFEHSTDAHLVFVDGKVLDCNFAALKMLDLDSKSAIIERTMADLSPYRQPDGGESRAKYQALERYARDTGGERFDWALRRGSNHELMVEISLTPVIVGEKQSMLAVWHDISERIAAQNIIKRSEQRIRDILDSTFQLMGLLAPDGTLLECNKAAYSLVDVTPEDVLGRKFWDTPWWSHSRELQTKLREHIIEVRSGTAVRFPAMHRASGGGFVHVDFAMTPIIVNDEVELIVVEGHDVTALYEARDAERQAREEAESANRAKSEFLARMSHEIRTPMNAIIGMTRLSLNTVLTERQRQYLESVDSAANSLLGIINDILDFSKIEAGKLELELIPFSLRDVLANVGAVVGMRAQEKGLEFVISDVDVPSHLVGDPLRLQQVLINLCDNGVKFTDAGHISLEVSQVSTPTHQVRLRFQIEDTGMGLSSEQQTRLFQSFTQVDASISRKYGGTGLGLTICRQLVNAMGGEISVQSTPGTGSLFSFELPFQLLDGRAPVPMLRRRRRAASEQILVVDDNPVCWKIAEKILLNDGYRVLVAESGAQAIALAQDRRRRIDLILMDWNLPDMNGVQAVDHIRTAFGDDCPPVVLVTAYGQDDVLKETDFQPAGFLSKPVNSSSLSELVERTLRRVRSDAREFLAVASGQGPDTVGPAPRLLLVEDNDINRFLAQENLLAVGLTVDSAENGSEALQRLDQCQYDLVLMDLQMPVMDGLECCRQIRTRFIAAQLPVIAMTANAYDSVRQRCEEVGMNGFVTKPFEPADLYHAIADNLDVEFSAWKRRLQQGDVLDQLQVPANLPGIELQSALHRVRGKLPAYVRLLEDFIDQFGQVAQGMEILLERNEREQCRALAHKVKGVSANLGFERVQALASRIEQGCGDPAVDLRQSLRALQQAVAEVVESAEALFRVASVQSATLEDLEIMPPEQLAGWLQTIRARLVLSEVLDDQQIRQLRRSIGAVAASGQVENLCRHIENFDYSAAVALLDQVLATLSPPPAASRAG